ncbi:MAG: 50S ribosomal protein L10 [Fidelibacterota bacterium]
MPNPAKGETVDRIAEKMRQARGIYFTRYLGLNVGEITELRRRFFRDGVEFEVVKNTLARRSAEKAGYDGLDEVFRGPTAIAFSYDDPVSPARVLKEFQASHDLPELKALIFEGEVMDRGVFNRIAALPGRGEILTRLLGRLSAPMTQLTRVLKGAMVGLVSALHQIKESKGS